MAGCFGNSPYDRYVEHQLYQYLDEGEDYEKLCLDLNLFITDKDWEIYENKINHAIDKYIAPRIQRGRMTLRQGQRLLSIYVNKLKYK